MRCSTVNGIAYRLDHRGHACGAIWAAQGCQRTSLLLMFMDSQSRPSYRPSPLVAHVAWMYLQSKGERQRQQNGLVCSLDMCLTRCVALRAAVAHRAPIVLLCDCSEGDLVSESAMRTWARSNASGLLSKSGEPRTTCVGASSAAPACLSPRRHSWRLADLACWQR